MVFKYFIRFFRHGMAYFIVKSARKGPIDFTEGL